MFYVMKSKTLQNWWNHIVSILRQPQAVMRTLVHQVVLSFDVFFIGISQTQSHEQLQTFIELTSMNLIAMEEYGELKWDKYWLYSDGHWCTHATYMSTSKLYFLGSL